MWELLILYTSLMAFGLLGLVLLGIRRERERLKRDYEDAIKRFSVITKYGRRG